MTKAEKAEQEKACIQLREWLSPGDTVYTILRSVSRSGMFRRIGLVAPEKDGSSQMMWLDGQAAKALGMKLSHKAEGLPMSGCGMDMGSQLVYELSYCLYPQGFTCLGERCPSNDHFNREEPPAIGPWTHKDGGYALCHRWL